MVSLGAWRDEPYGTAYQCQVGHTRCARNASVLRGQMRNNVRNAVAGLDERDTGGATVNHRQNLLRREGINLLNSASGVAGTPITYGSYGDGEVIVDGSAKVV